MGFGSFGFVVAWMVVIGMMVVEVGKGISEVDNIFDQTLY